MRAVVLIDDGHDESAHAFVARRWTRLLLMLQSPDTRAHLATMRHASRINDLLSSSGVPSVSLGLSSSWRSPLALVRLLTYCRKERIELIHGHQVIPAILAGCAARLLPGVTAVFFRSHTHGSTKLKWASRVAGRLCHYTMGGSKAVLEYALELDRTPMDRLRYVMNGVEDMRSVAATEIGELRHRLGISEEAAVVSTVCRLRSEKGLMVLLDAVEILVQERSLSVHVVVAGAGPEESNLKRRAALTLKDVVHFVGHQDDIALYHSVGDISVVPSLKEAFGLAAAEAMACARPVVGSAVGGLREVIADGSTGFLVPPSDPEELARGLQRLLEDAELRSKMGKAGQDRFQRMFTLATMVEGWRVCWQEFVTNGTEPCTTTS